MAQRLDVIDVSHYNPVSDWNAVKAAGVIAVIFKATEGTDVLDATYADGVAGADAAGVPRCAYHFIRHGSISEQMQFFWDTVAPRWGERMIIDYEDSTVTLDELHLAVNCLMQLSAATDRNIQITVYSGSTLKEALGSAKDDMLATNTDLWLAQYTSGAPSWPVETYPVYSLWQYSESGQVPGVDGSDVDLDMFNGSRENCLKWIGPVPQTVPAAVGTVDIMVAGNVAVTVNGQPVT